MSLDCRAEPAGDKKGASRCCSGRGCMEPSFDWHVIIGNIISAVPSTENKRRGQSDNRGLEAVKRKKIFPGKICIIGDDMSAFFPWNILWQSKNAKKWRVWTACVSRRSQWTRICVFYLGFSKLHRCWMLLKPHCISTKKQDNTKPS